VTLPWSLALGFLVGLGALPWYYGIPLGVIGWSAMLIVLVILEK
jgi:hypothetical protein